ncbi:hypothetical protein [Paenibacillus sp. IHBB 10380]|uniref:hypothetical protein n=1 Tax=Paenibacillus sp. IHBB 10380 TaxID=1566358 RepID=UPI0005CF947C|nr:hypothetical protein [Paenibacillus sp. IHBB 10380]AJS58826.1 hypothetical protein UB51_10455 [Paenibacillus sp. IHBB 10380]
MEIENELKKINERLENIEIKITQLNKEPIGERPAWLNFIVAFIVVFICILLFGGILILFF